MYARYLNSKDSYGEVDLRIPELGWGSGNAPTDKNAREKVCLNELSPKLYKNAEIPLSRQFDYLLIV